MAFERHPFPQFVLCMQQDGTTASTSVWFLVGTGGMYYGGYYWGLDRGYYRRDPFPHSVLSTRETSCTPLSSRSRWALPAVHASADTRTMTYAR